MSPLGDVLPTATRYVSTLTHPEARWPLFYYEVQLHQFLTPECGDATSASCSSATTSADNKEDMMDNEDEC